MKRLPRWDTYEQAVQDRAALGGEPEEHFAGCYCCPECQAYTRWGWTHGLAREAEHRRIVGEGKQLASRQGTAPFAFPDWASVVDGALDGIAARTEALE